MTISKQPPLVVEHWSAEDLLLARKLARRMLSGVGDDTREHEGAGRIVYERRRAMTTEEALMLVPRKE